MEQRIRWPTRRRHYCQESICVMKLRIGWCGTSGNAEVKNASSFTRSADPGAQHVASLFAGTGEQIRIAADRVPERCELRIGLSLDYVGHYNLLAGTAQVRFRVMTYGDGKKM